MSGDIYSEHWPPIKLLLPRLASATFRPASAHLPRCREPAILQIHGFMNTDS